LPGNEEGLACIDSYIYFRVFYRDVGASSTIGDFDLFSGSVLKVGGLYYPRLFFNGGCRDDSIGLVASGFTPGGFSALETGVFTMSWLGYSISAPLYSYVGEGYNPKLTATEYWSYGGTYDTTTGNPL
jgi:hypothetical protein